MVNAMIANKLYTYYLKSRDILGEDKISISENIEDDYGDIYNNIYEDAFDDVVENIQDNIQEEIIDDVYLVQYLLMENSAINKHNIINNTGYI
jgi:hypothetical protein